MITSWAEGEAMHKRVIYNSLSLKRESKHYKPLTTYHKFPVGDGIKEREER